MVKEGVSGEFEINQGYPIIKDDEEVPDSKEMTSTRWGHVSWSPRNVSFRLMSVESGHEAYIAVIRLIRKHLQYPQWDCYKVKDYAERQDLNNTFLKRHWPLSNGCSNKLDGHLTDPSQWSDSTTTSERENPPKKRVKKEPALKAYAVAAVKAAAAKPMIWDVENNCFVPF